MAITLTLDNWATQKEAARAIRYQVFVVEQNVPIELEWDDMDDVCLHANASNTQGEVLGTGRLLPDGHIGRMAVAANARGLGVGGQILQALMQAAQQRGDKRVVLNAQIQAQNFYAKYGFTQFGETFMDADIPHIAMELFFNAAEVSKIS